jgi:hypothetical protein
MFWLPLLSGCGESQSSKSLLPPVPPDQRVVVTNTVLSNQEAPIPPQCYTRTEGQHNPCYTCHQAYDRGTENPSRANQIDDGGLQGAYLFSDEGMSNHWQNLFTDRSEWLSKISDEQIIEYINQDNYSSLPDALEKIGWQGFVPDLKLYADANTAFLDNGIARDGSGWVAFNYKPFPGTFWPTNGSTDDVLIRLPKAFREIGQVEDTSVYLINLSILEAAIKQLDQIDIPPSNEITLQVDLDGDGKLKKNTSLLHKRDHYIGDASNIAVSSQQYPKGTEFMHSVRYVGATDDGEIYIPRRMKELRYMKKIMELAPYAIASQYSRERKEKRLDQLPSFIDHADQGMENGYGWLIQGFIEDYDGNLRPQSHEETFACMGCHSAIGVTIDQTFSFARKVTGENGWKYIDLKGMTDAPNINEPGGEIRNYLQRAGGGSEFRENDEMLARWYKEDGSVDDAKVSQADVYELITPSRDRALSLNKAYTQIVRQQSYIYGRDANWQSGKNIFKDVDDSTPPLMIEKRFFQWDIRLDWSD